MRGFWVFSFVFLLVACTDRSFTPVLPEALSVGRAHTVFAATSREPEDSGAFGPERSSTLRLLELTVSIPPSHEPGQLNFGYATPNPATQFTLAGRTRFESDGDFGGRLSRLMRALPADQREVTVFVHGFNATQAETAFRAAQVATDAKIPGATVIYSWPSRGKALAYAYDNDSAIFARDGLEQLLRQLTSVGARQIVLVAHSMGSLVVMETLRQIDIGDPGWAARELGGVILISPDLDVEVFRSQLSRLQSVPDPFLVFVSRKDLILDLSARLRGTSKRIRLGNIKNTELVEDLPIEIIDTTEFSRDAGSGHFVPATSPALLALLSQVRTVNTTFGRESISLTSILTGRPDTGRSEAPAGLLLQE
ncbi:MAG: alpha/beta hydrolase [Sedimentitalea sp.]